LFFLFADPHFKKANYRRRIINTGLLAEYAYCLAVGGLLYTITDVLVLHTWNVQHLSRHPLFTQVTNEELEKDPVVPHVTGATEEAKKVEAHNGKKFLAVFRRINPQ